MAEYEGWVGRPRREPPKEKSAAHQFCQDCGKAISPDATYCPQCGVQFGDSPRTSGRIEAGSSPGIAGVMGIIGGLSILAGIILCVQVWPGEPTVGYVWTSVAYVPSITWLFSGFVSGMLFFAAAAALSYLHAIRGYAEAIAQKLHEGGVAAQTSIEAGEKASGASHQAG